MALSIAKLQSLLIKGAAVASFVSGALTAANNNLPHFQSAVLGVTGTVVFLAERYWADVKKAL